MMCEGQGEIQIQAHFLVCALAYKQQVQEEREGVAVVEKIPEKVVEKAEEKVVEERKVDEKMEMMEWLEHCVLVAVV